ncbi:hypothetical protein K501DRAFT_272174 [Backusella circina FSU 941]|nr:hypothetical protein K501DRAFT_272174 [Backusella circina FSU 941]
MKCVVVPLFMDLTNEVRMNRKKIRFWTRIFLISKLKVYPFFSKIFRTWRFFFISTGTEVKYQRRHKDSFRVLEVILVLKPGSPGPPREGSPVDLLALLKGLVTYPIPEAVIHARTRVG